MTNRHEDEIRPTVLTDFQVEVARLFFSLTASDRFLLAGGATLCSQEPGFADYRIFGPQTGFS